MRFRFKIRTLLLLTAILSLPACYYGIGLRAYRMEAAALSQLQKDGWSFQAINSEMDEGQSSIGARAKRIINAPMRFVFGNKYTMRCTRLTLASDDSAKNLDVLANLRYLKDIELSGDGLVCDKFVDTLVGLERLESVEFFINNINVDSYQRLVRAGIQVRHYGLRDYRPAENFLRYGDRYHPIDFKKSDLSICLEAGDKGPRFSVEVVTFAPHSIDLGTPSPHLWRTPELTISGSIAEAIEDKRIVSQEAEEDDGSNFYDGIHQVITYNSVQLISRTEKGLRLKWRFTTGNDVDTGEVDAEFPVDKVFVYVASEGTKDDATEEAKQLLGEHFDPARFQEPVLGGKKNIYIFATK